MQLPGVAEAWVRASTQECSRALPLPAGAIKCQAPRTADVSAATAPSHHPAPHRLSQASPWGPEMCGELECSSVAGQLLCERRLVGAQVTRGWGRGHRRHRAAFWAWPDPAQQDITSASESSLWPIRDLLSDPQGQGEGAGEGVDLALCTQHGGD